MKLHVIILVWLAAVAVAIAQPSAPEAKTMTREGPIARVTRELYMPSPKAGQSYVIGNFYLAPTGLERYQVRTLQVHDDVYQDAAIRFSRDNGKTWSEWRHDADRDIRLKDGYAREPYIFTPTFDPSSKRMVRTTLLRTHKGDPRIAGWKEMWDHTVYQTSSDGGHVWSEPRLVKYGDGPEVSATNWGDPEYLAHNRSYSGYNVIPLREGGVATACCLTVQIPGEDGQLTNVGGVRLFVGKWDDARQQYDWTASTPIGVPSAVSDRGLMEPWVAQLRNGNLFIVMRGNATAINPGRHFYSVSSDGGKTLSEPQELRYDDGTEFYAPSSLSMMFRHSVTGKLYWFGNISAGPSSGNSPRYPLYIAEVGEDRPALQRETLTVVDDYDPQTQTAAVQFSNFSLIEDRETHDFDLTMTVWGEYPDVYEAHVYRYTIALK